MKSYVFSRTIKESDDGATIISDNAGEFVRSLKNEADFLQSVGVCRDCLKVYNVIDSALNAAAKKKSIEIKGAKFLAKLKA